MNSKSPGPDTKRLMTAISALLPEESRLKRTPTDEELRRSYPSSYKGDPANESKRRPGTD
jgi:putative phosphoserine phosphatase/1-acylglycerol-3-phosphate O-acyltransferase